MTRMSFGRACARICTIVALVGSLLAVGPADGVRADVRVKQRVAFTGHLGFAVTGAPLATDGPDADNNVDTLAVPGEASITTEQAPDRARVYRAFLYWSGTFDQPEAGACAGVGDDVVTLTTPDGASHEVTAAARYCSDGGAASYDVRSYRTNVSRLVRDVRGTFTLDDFEPDIGNASADNASFSVVVLYTHASLPMSTVMLHDGLVEMQHSEHTVSVRSDPVQAEPEAELAYHSVAGDPSTTGGESVQVTALPSAATATLTDAVNPPDDPMNSTINGRADTTGVDIDRFPLGILSPGDDGLDVVFDAGSDKWWLAYLIVRVAPIDLPELSIRDAAVVEGDSGFVRIRFVVRLSEAWPEPVTFRFRTRDGTATAASRDYRARSDEAVMPAGRRGRVVSTVVFGDRWRERHERFFMTLLRPQGAVLGDRAAVGTIQDDDR